MVFFTAAAVVVNKDHIIYADTVCVYHTTNVFLAQ